MNKFFIECGRQLDHIQVPKKILQDVNIRFTADGKDAINKLMCHLNLHPEDEVYIVSTFDATYVSKCVTCSIFNHAKPSKVLTDKTKAIYIIHDHGFPFTSMLEMIKLGKKMNIPLIEDCAHSITSKYIGKDGVIGSESDYTIFSFRKVFPVAVGGIGFKSENEFMSFNSDPHLNNSQEILWHLSKSSEYHSQRFINYSLLTDLTRKHVHVYKPIDRNISPYCFSIRHPDPNSFRNLFNIEHAHAFECVSWYGLPIVSFPCHQLIPEQIVVELAEYINQTAQKYKNENLG